MNNDGDTALIKAAAMNHRDVLTLILNNNANPDIQNKNGETALTIASDKNYLSIVNSLLANNAKTDLKQNS